MDTALIPVNVRSLYLSGTLNNFIYEYYIRHQAELRKYQSPEDFYTGFKKEGEVWNDLSNYVKKDSLSLDGLEADRPQTR